MKPVQKPKNNYVTRSLWPSTIAEVISKWNVFLDICTVDGHYIFPLVLQGHCLINQNATWLEEIIQEMSENKEWNKWHKFLCPLCYEGSNRLWKSLRKWTKTTQSSKCLWRFHYSIESNMLYQGYREDWHSYTQYQFDEYTYSEDEVFYFEHKERNITLEYMPVDTILVDNVIAFKGWQVSHYQIIQQSSSVPAPITNLVQFIKSQLE